MHPHMIVKGAPLRTATSLGGHAISQLGAQCDAVKRLLWHTDQCAAAGGFQPQWVLEAACPVLTGQFLWSQTSSIS